MVIPAETRVRFGRKISPLKQLVETERASAEEVASAILFVWARRIQPDQAPKRAPNNTAALVADPRVSTFVDWLCTLERFEEAAYWVATSYATLVGDETRTQRALYFTHPVLAERVIDDLLTQGASLLEDHWHDPACGGAAFLVPVALRMRKALSHHESVNGSLLVKPATKQETLGCRTMKRPPRFLVMNVSLARPGGDAWSP